ncbi:MAG: hypothetical protein PHH54_07005 [Candidatus Nanoarchaeia archaeon]|nr:hypothetical protein [Candidatus Nanoarchaeia archaeon]MDD5741703.1 hypothetical protein [Candidatus Nanoarchaeia archaeon]
MDKKEMPLNSIYEDERGTYIVYNGDKGTMPVISINANTIPAAWELAVLSCFNHGTKVSTHYDREGDPPSIEATIMVRVENPFNEPRIHKNFPGGPKELEVYRQEVVEGIHDHWINPREGKWTYTYHNRIFNYNPSSDLNAENMGKLLEKGVNQIEEGVIKPLLKDITSKGAQATTWIPMADPASPGDRPCLQHLWFRVLENDNNYYLNLETLWRSRDLYKAWFMNAYALSDLQRKVAGILSERTNKKINVGCYIDISNSLHIYGQDHSKENFKDDIKKMREESIEKRIWNSDHPAFKIMTEETREDLAKDPDFYAKGNVK